MPHARRSIRARLALLNLYLAVAPLAVVGVAVAVFAYRFLERQATNTLESELHGVGVEVSLLLEALRADAAVARAFAIPAQRSRLGGVLGTFAAARPKFRSVFALAEDGMVVARAAPTQGRESPYYATLAEGLAPGASAVVPVELRADGADLVRPTLAVVAPLPKQAPASALVLELDADTMLNIFRRTSDALGGILAVVTVDGRFLFHSVQYGRGRALLATSGVTLASEFPPGEAHLLLSQDRGRFTAGDRFVVFQTLPSADPNPDGRLVIYREESVRVLTATARRLALLLAGALGVTLALALAVAGAAARRFTRPILSLRDASRALAEGRTDAPPDIATGDEIEELAHAFATMAREVQQRRNALESLVTELRATEALLRVEEAALRRSEATYHSLVDSSPHAICRAAADGTLQAVNPAMVSILGYESERDLLGRTMPGAVYADPKEWIQLTDQLRDDGRVVGREGWWQHRDGHAVAVRLGGRAVRGEEGVAEFFEMVVEDVSDRRSLEDQLRQAQKLEAVGQLAGGMAHDFNNLLTAILGSAELMTGEVAASSPIRGDLDAIRKAAERGRDLIQKLLGFTRQEPLNLRRIRLRDHLTGFVDVLRRVVREDVTIELKFGEDEPAVLADQGSLEQVLLNLVTNARDALPSGGRITIQTGRSVMDQDFCMGHGWGTPGEYATLIVSDTGVGMTPEVRRRVFEPFFTTKAVGAGTGLGMSLVYGLVRQQNGYVQVYSEVGRGTVVRVYLPATTEPLPQIVTAPSPPAARTGTEVILLVEDEEWVRKVAQRVLERHGYRVLPADDGVTALEIVRKGEKFDLIISDVVMPKMGGPQLQVELRNEGRNPKMLFTSGYTERDIEQSARLNSDAPFLSKPWTIDEFLVRVREVLDA